MHLKLFKSKPGDAAAIAAEADALEARLGPAGAVRHVRARIAEADRLARPHLYRLHDEIVRRHPSMMST